MLLKFLSFIVPSALMCYFFPLVGIGLATSKFWIAFIFFSLISETIRFGFFEEKLTNDTVVLSTEYTKVFIINIVIAAGLVLLFGLIK